MAFLFLSCSKAEPATQSREPGSRIVRVQVSVLANGRASIRKLRPASGDVGRTGSYGAFLRDCGYRAGFRQRRGLYVWAVCELLRVSGRHVYVMFSKRIELRVSWGRYVQEIVVYVGGTNSSQYHRIRNVVWEKHDSDSKVFP